MKYKQLKLTEELHKRLKIIASKKGLTMIQLIKLLLDTYE